MKPQLLLIACLFGLAVSLPMPEDFADEDYEGSGDEDLVGGRRVVSVVKIVKRHSTSPIPATLPTDNYVAHLKTDIEAQHTSFMKVYNTELYRLRNLTRRSHITEAEYKKAQLLLNRRYAEWKKTLEDLRVSNSTLTSLKYKADDYKNEVGLLSYLYEYIKIFRSVKDKETLMKHSCICNSTKIK
jgi:hypothetical protein